MTAISSGKAFDPPVFLDDRPLDLDDLARYGIGALPRHDDDVEVHAADLASAVAAAAIPFGLLAGLAVHFML